MIKIKITEYSEPDNKCVVDLILNIQQNEFDVPISLNDQPDLKNIVAFYRKGNGNFWIATINKKVVGTIALLDIGNGKVALRKMFVQSEFRGSKFGVAQDLLNTVFIWAGKKRVSTILLGTTEKFLAAQRFYEKNGFKEISRLQLPKEFPVMSVDVKFYEYKINTSQR